MIIVILISLIIVIIILSLNDDDGGKDGEPKIKIMKNDDDDDDDERKNDAVAVFIEDSFLISFITYIITFYWYKTFFPMIKYLKAKCITIETKKLFF